MGCIKKYFIKERAKVNKFTTGAHTAHSKPELPHVASQAEQPPLVYAPGFFVHFSTAACLFMLVTFINRLAKKKRRRSGREKREEKSAKAERMKSRKRKPTRSAVRLRLDPKGGSVQRGVCLLSSIELSGRQREGEWESEREIGSTCKFINQSTNHIEYRILLLPPPPVDDLITQHA